MQPSSARVRALPAANAIILVVKDVIEQTTTASAEASTRRSVRVSRFIRMIRKRKKRVITTHAVNKEHTKNEDKPDVILLPIAGWKRFYGIRGESGGGA